MPRIVIHSLIPSFCWTVQQWTVVRTRSTRTMSFPLSIMSCLVTLSWTAYGLHVADNFIFYPNAVG